MTDPTTETARYRKKPIAVEARQVPPSSDGKSGLELAAWCGGSVSGTYAEPKIFVPTLEGELVARVGDWIVKGTRGEFWPVKGDIFAETYEPAAAPPVDRAAVLLEAEDVIEGIFIEDENPDERSLGFNEGLSQAIAELRRLAAETPQPETQAAPDGSDGDAPDDEPSEEQTVRDHVTTLHLIGEQLSQVENWMWQHLADVRDTAPAAVQADGEA